MRNAPDISSSSSPQSSAPSRSHSRRRRWVRAIWLLGFLSPFLWLGWHLFGPPEQIVVSHETTRVTSPLKADGRTVDYASALRLQYESPQAVPFEQTPLAELLRRRAAERPSPEGKRQPTLIRRVSSLGNTSKLRMTATVGMIVSMESCRLWLPQIQN